MVQTSRVGLCLLHVLKLLCASPNVQVSQVQHVQKDFKTLFVQKVPMWKDHPRIMENEMHTVLLRDGKGQVRRLRNTCTQEQVQTKMCLMLEKIKRTVMSVELEIEPFCDSSFYSEIS
jgi:hypothetical protein